ncbi:unnamed protein product [Somion occarium]|uniref:SMP domain-containing protein n=1 Tax=Somion occarium TaxID=3059160 RepID=A0ABP1CQC8_9APHY
MSMNGTAILTAAHDDAARFGARIDLKNISEADARKLMSAEHKALGFRPPPGSLAAEAQAEAARHPKTDAQISLEALRKAALEDAERIKGLRSSTGEVNLNVVGQAEARKLMSDEHKALGYRPTPGSLAAEAQSAAAKHPEGVPDAHPEIYELHRAALEDAAKIESSAAAAINLDAIGEAEARKLMSEEHKVLGYRPPPGSLAAEAQSAAAKHPTSSAGVDAATLAKAALEDAKKIESIRRSSNGTATAEKMNGFGRRSSGGSSSSEKMSPERRAGGGSVAAEKINPEIITAAEAHQLQSEEQKTLGYRPPSDSLAAQVQSAVDKRDRQPVTKDIAASLESQEHKAVGHLPEKGSIAAVAQSLADQNENDGGERTLADAGIRLRFLDLAYGRAG